MKKLSIGTWLKAKEVALIKDALIEEIGQGEVYCDNNSQYLESVIKFSKMRGHNEQELISIAESALL